MAVGYAVDAVTAQPSGEKGTVGKLVGAAIDKAAESDWLKDWLGGCIRRVKDPRVLPGNHDLLRGIRYAHLTAVARVGSDYRARLRLHQQMGYTLELSGDETAFVERLDKYLHPRLRLISDNGIDHDAVGPDDIANALEHLVSQRVEATPMHQAAAQARQAAVERALAELRTATGPLPPAFETIFRGADERAGWYAVFGLYLAEQIKTNPRFRDIFFTAELLETRHILQEINATVARLLAREPDLASYLQDLRGKLEQIGHTVARIELAVDEIKGGLVAAAAPVFTWPTPNRFEALIDAYVTNFAGREWLLDRVQGWLHDGGRRGLLILAPFGVGKSAFMARLATTLRQRGITTALHFCRFDDNQKVGPGQVVRNLAAQLAVLPEYRQAVEQDPAACKALANADTDAELAWSRAIVDPLTLALERRADDQPIVLMVDGLDESLELHTTGSSHEGTLLKLIEQGTASRLPRQVRVIASSRPDDALLHLRERFLVMHMIGPDGDDNRRDLAEFIRARAGEGRLPQLWAAAGFADEAAFTHALNHLCEGKFLLARYVLNEAQDSRFDAGGLREMLERARGVSGMDSYFSHVFPARLRRARLQAPLAQMVLGQIAVSLAPLSERVIADVLAAEGVSLDDVRHVVTAFGGLLRFDDDAGVTFDHLSIEQWLDPSRSEGCFAASQRPKAGELAIDRPASMARLQRHCLRLATLPTKEIEQRGFSAYLQRYGVLHLIDAGDVRAALALLTRLPLNLRRQARGRLAEPPPPRRLEARLIDAIDTLRQAFDRGDADAARILTQLDPEQLSRLLRHRDYETGKYQPVLRTLIQFKPLEWATISAQLLQAQPDDLVLRNDMGVANAEAWHSSRGADRQERLAGIMALAQSADPDEREIAGYALRHICQKLEPDPPWWREIEDPVRALAARYAGSPRATDRMVAGEMLLALTLQGEDVTHWLAGAPGEARFWQPYWPNQRMDIEAIHAHTSGRMVWSGPRPSDLEASFASALAQRDEAVRLGASFRGMVLFDEKTKPHNLERLSWALGCRDDRTTEQQFGDQQCDKIALDETLGDLLALVDRPEAAEVVYGVIRRLMLHPSWDLIETGSSLLADLIKRKGRSNGPWWIMARLLREDPVHWRLLYGAVDASFNVGPIDGYQAFRRAIVAVGALPQCRVRGICADNLRMWLKTAAPDERQKILADADIRQLLHLWLQTADDEWLLEYLHLIYSELAANRVALDAASGLLPEQLSPYLEVGADKAFYELDADEFRDRIEACRSQEWEHLKLHAAE